MLSRLEVKLRAYKSVLRSKVQKSNLGCGNLSREEARGAPKAHC